MKNEPSQEERIAKAVTHQGRSERQPAVKPQHLLSSGSTLINLACSSRIEGAFGPGLFYFLVGDSRSGKTWLAHSCFAEAVLHPFYKNHRLIRDDVENGALMDVARFFGQAVQDKIEPPRGTREAPENSDTIEDFYYNIDDALKDGRPFIYVLDSLDSLDSKAADKKFDEQKKFDRPSKGDKKGKPPAGSFGMDKAKKNSDNLRRVIRRLRDTKSILIVISQTRDNVDPYSYSTKTRAGGRALTFYSHVEMWSEICGRMDKTIKDKKLNIGIKCKLTIQKNRISGKMWQVVVPIYNNYGMDDIGSMIDFAIEWKHWNEGKVLVAPEFKFTGSRDKLIRKIENENLEKDLKETIKTLWREIEEATNLNRKARYR